MKKLLFALLALTLILTGCSTAAAEEALHPLDDTVWPTPKPTMTLPPATPFPKISLADIATATPTPVKAVVTPTLIESVQATAPTAIATTKPQKAFGPDNQADLLPVAQAKVQSEALNMRQGPGPNYPRLGTLAQGDTVDLLALNSTRDWALVRSPNPGQGWVSLAYLTFDRSLTAAPILAEDNWQVEDSGLKIEDSGLEVEHNREAWPPPSLLLPTTYSLLPGASIRPGPGLEYAPIDTISDPQEEITVLGVDNSGQWALVQPTHARVGWMAVSDLNLKGDVSALPPLVTAWVEHNELTLRRGPGIYTEAVGAVPINSLVIVAGLNKGRNWAHIRPVVGDGSGWLPLSLLTLHAPAANLPLEKGEDERIKDESSFNPQSAISNLHSPISNSDPHLVFQLASGGDIMVINPDGTGLRRLTTGMDPALSPDGQTVAFTRWQGETGSLWLVNLDSSNEHTILDFTKQAKGPAWSPDGRQIVVNFQQGGRLEEKTECADVLKDPDPAIPWNGNIHNDNNGDPKIKIVVDGRKVKALVCWDLLPDPHWQLRVVNVADGRFEDLDGGTYAFRPTWDPAQPWRIVSAGGKGLVEADVTQKTSRRLTEEFGDREPVFSPDGGYLAVTMRQGESTDIYRLNAAGSGRTRLTQTPLWVTSQPDKPKPWRNVAPTWSPDGTQIAFLTDRTGRWEIWVMQADGINPHPMFPAEISDQLTFTYDGADEQVLSWR